MIEWCIEMCNENQGFVMILLTFFYVVATLILVGISFHQTKLTRRSIASAELAEKRRHRPHVVFDLYSEGLPLYASLRNNGATPAYNVRLSMSPEIYTDIRGEKRLCPLVGRSITFLASMREIRDACAMGGVFDTNFPNPIFTGMVCYEDADGTQYEEEYKIDLRAQRQLLHVGKKDVGAELAKISDVLKSLVAAQK